MSYVHNIDLHDYMLASGMSYTYLRNALPSWFTTCWAEHITWWVGPLEWFQMTNVAGSRTMLHNLIQSGIVGLKYGSTNHHVTNTWLKVKFPLNYCLVDECFFSVWLWLVGGQEPEGKLYTESTLGKPLRFTNSSKTLYVLPKGFVR